MRALAGLFGCIAWLVSTAPASARALVAEAAPLVRLTDGVVSACGVEFTAPDGAAALKAEFFVRKAGPNTEFVFTARYDGPFQIFDMSLVTDGGSTAALLPRPQPKPDGWMRTRGPIAVNIGGEMMRSLMVTGGKMLIGLTGSSGDFLDVTIPGPLPQNVRANYLNCAGDLVRP